MLVSGHKTSIKINDTGKYGYKSIGRFDKLDSSHQNTDLNDLEEIMPINEIYDDRHVYRSTKTVAFNNNVLIGSSLKNQVICIFHTILFFSCFNLIAF